jgi:hypothetical protein
MMNGAEGGEDEITTPYVIVIPRDHQNILQQGEPAVGQVSRIRSVAQAMPGPALPQCGVMKSFLFQRPSEYAELQFSARAGWLHDPANIRMQVDRTAYSKLIIQWRNTAFCKWRNQLQNHEPLAAVPSPTQPGPYVLALLRHLCQVLQ